MGFAWLQESNLQELLACLGNARAVGGAVRNGLMGLSVHEVDIATSLSPNEVMAKAKVAGFVVHPTGIAHGTVTCVKNGHAFEVTSLRVDVASDGRHAQIAFTDDWQEDAKRRDFTINALYCDAAGEIYDPVGGLQDIHARRVCFVGDAQARIREDYLRILRFFRFFAQYGAGEMDAEGLTASQLERHGLLQLSAERIEQELAKLMVAPRAGEALIHMQKAEILPLLLPNPQLEDLLALMARDIEQNAVPDYILRLVVLAPDVQVPEKLRFSRANNKRFAAILQAPRPNKAQMKQQIYQLGADIFTANVRRFWPPDAANMLAFCDQWDIPKLPVAAADLISLGLMPGPELGQALKAIEAEWLNSDFTKNKQALLAPYRED